MASTSDDLFGLIDAGDTDAVRALLAEQPWLAAERDDEGVSPLLRARYRMDKGMVEAVRIHVERLNVFEAATFGDLDRLTELLAEDPALVDAMSGDGSRRCISRRSSGRPTPFACCSREAQRRTETGPGG